MLRRLVLAVALLVAAFAATPARAFDFNVLAGFDYAGDFEAENFEFDANSGYHAGLEFMWDVTKRFEFGLGLEYGFPRDADDTPTDSDLEYWMAAGVARIYLVGEDIRWYLIGRLGYVDLTADDLQGGDLSGKEQYSAGTGLQFGDRLKLEALLNSFNADIEISGLEADFEYTNYSARIVFTF